MAADPATVEALQRLVRSNDGHNEVECGNFLEHAAELLCALTSKSIIEMERENRSFFGSSDYLVSALCCGETGDEERYLFVWELKSPQCEIMERDNNANRYRPSKHLIKAENQILHYVHEAQGSDIMRERYGITTRYNILPGGIIIGRDDKFCGPGGDQEAAKLSFKIRNRMIYKPAQLRVMTWDRVIDHMQP